MTAMTTGEALAVLLNQNELLREQVQTLTAQLYEAQQQNDHYRTYYTQTKW